MSLDELNKQLSAINVIQGNEFRAKLQDDDGDDMTPEENWDLMVNSVRQFTRAKKWDEALDALVYLSNQDNNPLVFSARAQAAWLALKTPVPVSQVTQFLYKLMITLTATHPAAPAMASLANFMVNNRKDEDPDRPLAEFHVQQMYQHCLDDPNGEATTESFQKWVTENQLDQPDYFIPIVMEVLEELVGDSWWVDRATVEADMTQA
ncbi:MAG: hypothetical protein HQL54_11765 [Magnetococcales bacterium]|nr:hypothetical protein [Magnetococcales bacterium]